MATYQSSTGQDLHCAAGASIDIDGAPNERNWEVTCFEQGLSADPASLPLHALDARVTAVRYSEDVWASRAAWDLGVPLKGFAQHCSLSLDMRLRARQLRATAWDIDSSGAGALPLNASMASDSFESLPLNWSIPLRHELCDSRLWSRIAGVHAGTLTLGRALCACEAALDRARAWVRSGAPMRSDDARAHEYADVDLIAGVDLRARADWRAVALADIGLHLWAIAQDTHQPESEHSERADLRDAAGYTAVGPGAIADVPSEFADYGPDRAERSALLGLAYRNISCSRIFLNAENALTGLSAGWLMRSGRLENDGVPPWIEGWQNAVQAFGGDTLLTDIQNTAVIDAQRPMETKRQEPF